MSIFFVFLRGREFVFILFCYGQFFLATRCIFPFVVRIGSRSEYDTNSLGLVRFGPVRLDPRASPLVGWTLSSSGCSTRGLVLNRFGSIRHLSSSEYNTSGLVLNRFGLIRFARLFLCGVTHDRSGYDTCSLGSVRIVSV